MATAVANAVAGQGAVPAGTRSLWSKLVLLAGSIALIWAIAGAWQIPLFILALITVAWGVIVALDIRLKEPVARRRAGSACVAAIMLGLIAANMTGALSTLTGLAESLEGQLPIMLGISFYALQVSGVASDLLRGEIARPRFLDYLLFILLGFKFYSGPLERAIDLDRIVNRVPPLTLDRVWEGFSWTLLGVFMKFVIGNPLVEFIDLDTANPIATFWVATVAELRIYFDFAGYSFMAVGLAKIAGIELTNNFRQPLYAPNIRDFWHRWHVSLGQWLRQYIYYPAREALRERAIKTRLLAPSVFFVSALWHGATFNFALWGIIHAFVFWLYVVVLSKRRWPSLLAHLSIILLLIFVRLLYIDDNAGRLAGKLAAFGSIDAWRAGFAALASVRPSTIPQLPAIAVALGVIFIALEALSAKRYGTLDYRLFRTLPGMAAILVLTLLLAHQQPEAIFVYARH
ncbi:MBOAT family O-acyltransferase [Sphingomonas sp.]|uniref:MBOAT family O-acyltransferase n=1 Tax=Sphingomonas sp. TaxID=28214 RepID=UPI0031DA4ED0